MIVTQFISIIYQIFVSQSDSNEWIIDFVSNVNFTSFKESLEYYQEFDKSDKVKKFSDKLVFILNIKSITIDDSHDHKYIIMNIFYISESMIFIILMMKIKRFGFNFHFLKDYDEDDFLLSFKTFNFEIVRYIIDDIL